MVRVALSLSLRMERNVQGLEDLDERFDSAVKLLIGMGSHEREADQRIARSDSRSHDGIDEDTLEAAAVEAGVQLALKI